MTVSISTQLARFQEGSTASKFQIQVLSNGTDPVTPTALTWTLLDENWQVVGGIENSSTGVGTPGTTTDIVIGPSLPAFDNGDEEREYMLIAKATFDTEAYGGSSAIQYGMVKFVVERMSKKS